jgi:hypothetical protein
MTKTLRKNVQESLRLRKAIRARQSQCYMNCCRAVQEADGYSGATYIEGFAIVHHSIIEHAWLVRDGEIVDPTLAEEVMRYFPGLSWEGVAGLAEAMALPVLQFVGIGPQAKLVERPLTRGDHSLPFFYRFGWGGRASPSFAAARKKAEAAARR